MHRHDPEPETRTRWAAGHVIAAVVIALVVGALFNARDILATAERQPFGATRSVSVTLAKGLVGVSSALQLDEPRNAIDTALGRGPESVATLEPEPDPATSEPEAYEPVEVTPDPTEDPTLAASPEPEPEPTRGPITAEDPLTLYIGGDSMVEIQFGTALEDLADDTGVIQVEAIEFDRGSGLSRPDFVDWPAKLAAASTTYEPEVMVVYFGGNDAQPLKIDGTVYEPEDAEWQEEYRSRVAGVMDQLTEAGSTVYWMGLPIPRDEKVSRRFAILNDIYTAEAEAHDGVTFVAAWDLFAGPDGRYSEYLPNRKGDEVDMRLGDGIHLTTAGAYHLARPTIARIMDDFGIPPVEEG